MFHINVCFLLLWECNEHTISHYNISFTKSFVMNFIYLFGFSDNNCRQIRNSEFISVRISVWMHDWLRIWQQWALAHAWHQWALVHAYRIWLILYFWKLLRIIKLFQQFSLCKHLAVVWTSIDYRCWNNDRLASNLNC